jgi:uncharacterized protein YbbC (DUF1343 family)
VGIERVMSGEQTSGINRRAVLTGLTALGAAAMSTPPTSAAPSDGVKTGAMVAAAAGFAVFANRRIGLITNQTGRIGTTHLVDRLATTPGVRLTAIFAPEHGFRGKVEAGAGVADGRDVRTGLPIYSLYGATKAPAGSMLRGLDALVFDIQDIGVRFYTYISTLGLAMQAAARQRVPFIVLDRPNPLGGLGVAGFVLEPRLKSFVGQYPIPIVHGMTVGELARMLQSERWLDGLEDLDLTVVPCAGLTRSMLWPAMKLPWIATSPNIPTFEAALVYPGIGMVGETLMNEGRGTPTPFSQFGAPWLDAPRLAAELSTAQLPGVRFEAVRYTPRAIPEVALTPRFLGEDIAAVRLHTVDAATFRPLETGMHVLAHLQNHARARAIQLLPSRIGMFQAIAGTPRLHRLLERGSSGVEIVGSWHDEVARFRSQRTAHLLY